MFGSSSSPLELGRAWARFLSFEFIWVIVKEPEAGFLKGQT